MRGTEDRIADAITAFAGTMPFVYVHAAWFTVWIVCNEGVFGQEAVWDPFPFGLLTMIVSLEAIFLSTFVMVSQNRQAARENIRADLDFETNVLFLSVMSTFSALPDGSADGHQAVNRLFWMVAWMVRPPSCRVTALTSDPTEPTR
ncbi:DUF1003 domain-containing protein [Streptomyces sp. NPDC007971]|uniref:DUF1003 domain-containing protein n=1 Tax=Streptomyces sp. NPDC007971 TaxID=3364799 RepID=UPI0036E359C4